MSDQPEKCISQLIRGRLRRGISGIPVPAIGSSCVGFTASGSVLGCGGIGKYCSSKLSTVCGDSAKAIVLDAG